MRSLSPTAAITDPSRRDTESKPSDSRFLRVSVEQKQNTPPE